MSTHELAHKLLHTAYVPALEAVEAYDQFCQMARENDRLIRLLRDVQAATAGTGHLTASLTRRIAAATCPAKKTKENAR